MNGFVKYFKYDAEAIEFALVYARDHGYRVAAYGWESSNGASDKFVIHFK